MIGVYNMKKTVVIAMVFLLIAGIAYAKDYEVKKKAGQYDVEVKIDKNPPVVGDNNVSIEIKDESGKHVTDAKVRVDYSMPAMPGMPAMNYKTDATVSGNVYKAVMNLSMSGPWNITVKIVRAGKTSSAKFSIDAR
jgi:outer membrane translocation and assembly module TamA